MKERLANFDVLRCMLMLMVTLNHFITHGMKSASVNSEFCFHLNEPIGCLNYIFSQNVHNVAFVAVNCFVFISGYFTINDSTLRINKLIRLWLQVLFYSLVISVVMYLLYRDISIKDVLKSAIPIKTNMYWFMTNYFALSLLSPFISKVAKDLTKQQYLILLGILAFLTTEMYKFPYGYTYGNNWGTSLLFFVFLFLIGGYFKNYGFFFSKCRRGVFFCWLIGLFFAMSYGGIVEVKGMSFALVSHAPYHSWTLITSILFFQWFIGIKIKKSYFTKLLCNCAPFTLAVYLIQEHPLVRPKLWEELIVLNAKNVNSLYFVIMYITIPIGIFTSCILIDYLRTRIYPPLSCTTEWRITL